MLLQRIYALEAYVTSQDQRILHLEAEIQRINGPPQHYHMICGIPPRYQRSASQDQPHRISYHKTPYRDAAAKRLPDLASAVFKEQAERLKRLKSIVIRDRSSDSLDLHHYAGPYDNEQKESLCTWLSSHALTPEELSGLCAPHPHPT